MTSPIAQCGRLGTRAWLSASLLAHAALVAVLFYPLSSNWPSSPQLVRISEIITSQARRPGLESGAVVSQTKPSLTALGEEDIRASVTERSTHGSEASLGIANNSGETASDQGESSGANLVVGSDQPSVSETNLLNATNPDPGGKTTFGEQSREGLPGLTVTRYRDWQFGESRGSFEDNKLTYSDPNSPIKVAFRESSSPGFAARSSMRSPDVSDGDTLSPFGLIASDLSADSMARSQRVDWTLVNSETFGVTAFGYNSEVGQGFKPLEQGKNQFGKAGKSVMKAGGEVRVGAFSFGLAQSSITDTAAAGTNFRSMDRNPTLQQEATASVNLSQLVPGSLAQKLLPALWMSASTSQESNSGQANQTIATGIGGTWTWSMGYASFGYWNYSSGRDSGVGTTWGGHGFDANVGAYRSSFGIDAGLSYGQSEDAAPSWQAGGASYSSYATVWYKPDKIPGVSLTAAAGNYDQNSITYGPTWSYAMNSNGEYLSLTAGLDLTSLFWEASTFGTSSDQQRSVKMFYRYSNSLYFDDASDATSDVDSLVAISIQRSF